MATHVVGPKAPVSRYGERPKVNPAAIQKFKPGVQAEGESPFSFLDRQKWEHEKTGLLLKCVRGGKYMGRKPSGAWWLEIHDATPKELKSASGYVYATVRLHKREAREIVMGSPVDLVLAAVVETCAGCGCDTSMHAEREPTEAEDKGKHKGKKRCGGQRLVGEAAAPCVCAKAPEEIRNHQGSKKWLAERLASEMQKKELPGHRAVNESNVFDGMRGAE